MGWIASRVRRLLCLLTLLAGIVMPTILRLFFIADKHKSRLTHNNWESLVEADAFFTNDDADDSVDAEAADTKSMSSSKIIMTTKEYRRNAHDYFTRINAGHYYESNRMMLMLEAIEYNQIDQKRTIHVIVTTIIAFLLPFLAFLYAFIFQKETQGSIVRSLNTRRRRRKERQILHQGLQECRIQLPTTTLTPEDTTSAATDDDDKQRRECPICLLAFTAGDMVIASKHCHCSSIRATKATRGGTDIIASIANNNSLQSQFCHRIFFHEQCIFTWLSQRTANPKKLCPCCRQPFLDSIEANGSIRSS